MAVDQSLAEVPSPVEDILGGADDRRRIREAIRAEEDAEREAVRARAVADAAEAATKLWERGGEMAEQISLAELRAGTSRRGPGGGAPGG